MLSLPLLAWQTPYFIYVVVSALVISVLTNIASRIVMRGLMKDIIGLYHILKELEDSGVISKDRSSVSDNPNT